MGGTPLEVEPSLKKKVAAIHLEWNRNIFISVSTIIRLALRPDSGRPSRKEPFSHWVGGAGYLLVLFKIVVLFTKGAFPGQGNQEG